MNTSRRTILVAYLLVVSLLCLWVPWRASTSLQEEPSFYVGYGPVWKGPRLKPPARDGDLAQRLARVDLQRLGLTVVAATALAALAFCLVPARSV